MEFYILPLKPKVLILSNKEDLHAEKVIHHLEDLQIEFDLFDYGDFINKYACVYSFDDAYDRCALSSNDKSLDLSTYTAVWHRRPGTVRIQPGLEPWITRIMENETRGTLAGLWQTMRCLWVNHPLHDHAVLQKLGQLDLARRIGFRIPRTLVTNKPQEVRDFFSRCAGKVIYKFISEHSAMHFPANERPPGMGTTGLREEDLPFLDQVSCMPHIFQEQIQKQIEIRATVVGKRIFAVSIDSQAGQGAIDWRNDYSVEMKPIQLPEQVSAMCLLMMEKLQLNYGAFDLILDAQGNYVFIEVNCAGQFLWAETRSGLPISLAMAELLSGAVPPLVPCRN